MNTCVHVPAAFAPSFTSKLCFTNNCSGTDVSVLIVPYCVVHALVFRRGTCVSPFVQWFTTILFLDSLIRGHTFSF